MQPKGIYIAGPMSGQAELNFPAFMEAEEILAAKYPDAKIFNPARIDLERWGDLETVMANANYRNCLPTDLAWIIENASHIVLLPGWEYSRGVRVEKALADALDIPVLCL